MLLTLAGLVLLIASVNVATMLLARAVVRRREIAVRLALGAARGRLIRQLLTESVTLFLLGGAAGTRIAVWGTRLLEQIDLPVDMPLALDLSPDLRALAFTLIVALLTGIGFGLAPALQASRLDFAVDASWRHERQRTKPVAAPQLAHRRTGRAVARAVERVGPVRARARPRPRVDPGFDVNNVATTALDVGTAGYDEASRATFYRELAARLAAVPGVMSVGYARILPLSMNNTRRRYLDRRIRAARQARRRRVSQF